MRKEVTVLVSIRCERLKSPAKQYMS